MKTKHLYIALSFVVLVSMACTCSALPDLTAIANDLATPTGISSSGGGSTATKAATAASGSSTATSAAPKPTAGKYDTVFPLPSSVKNFTATGTGKESPVNFQTDMNVKDTIAFYRKEFTTMKLKERTLLTSNTDTTFSMVFDGYSNGKALVIQGVSLGAASTNVNMRFETLP